MVATAMIPWPEMALIAVVLQEHDAGVRSGRDRLSEHRRAHVAMAAWLEHQRPAKLIRVALHPVALLCHRLTSRPRQPLVMSRSGAPATCASIVLRTWSMRLRWSQNGRDVRALIVRVVSFQLRPATGANPESSRLRARAYEYALNLDYDEATRRHGGGGQGRPERSGVERGLAAIPWMMISFRRGTVTVDEYLGGVSRQNVALSEPPADLASRFSTHIQRSIALADAQAEAKPRDPDAHHQVGATVGLQASYIATVEGRIVAAFRAARRAYDESETVLELDPSRKDAGLVVGMYRYVVSIMPLPIRMMAYVAGFGGGKERGLQMIEEAAAYPSDSQADARIALVSAIQPRGEVR